MTQAKQNRWLLDIQPKQTLIYLQLKERKGKQIKKGRNEPIYHKITITENERFIIMEKLS